MTVILVPAGWLLPLMVPVVATWYHWLAWKKCVPLLYPNGWTSIILHRPIWSRHQDDDFLGGVPVLRYSHYFLWSLSYLRFIIWIDLNLFTMLNWSLVHVGTWTCVFMCFLKKSRASQTPSISSVAIPCFHTPRCNWWESFDCSWRHRPKKIIGRIIWTLGHGGVS